MRTVNPRRILALHLGVVLAILVSNAGVSAADEPPGRQDQVTRFNVISGAPGARSTVVPQPPGTPVTPYPLTPATEVSDVVSVSREMTSPGGESIPSRGRRPLGSTSVSAGQGRGESIALTFFDIQSVHENGRQIAHWYNGLTGPQAEVSVHFGYVNGQDTSYQYYWPNAPYVTVPNNFWTAYNVYDATGGGDWPRNQDIGCDLQAADTAGAGYTASLDMMHNGLVVMGGDTRTRRFSPDPLIESYRVIEGYIYYQGVEFDCTYSPYGPTNVSWVDSSYYRGDFLSDREGVYLRNPQVCTQWDGSNTIVHLLAGENSGGTQISYPDYGDRYYWVWLYFRKIGDTYSAGTWEEMIPIDTIDWVNMHMAAQDFPGQGVAVAYANVSPSGVVYGKPDRDVFCRESLNYGVTWQTSYNITNYDNAVKDGANHGNASFEVHCMYDSENDLHMWFTGTPTSADPYNDGFDWYNYNRNLYHWEKTNGNGVPGVGTIVKVANGNFMNPDQLTGGINQLVCGFGGSNAGYIAWSTMGECDGNLYLVWSQIHERANADWTAWQKSAIQPAPGILDDCSRVGNRGGMANWELMMSVARMQTSTLWDYPRNISNTYRPNCGLESDPEATTVCASEWKPQLEKRALDETGLDELTWPENSKVDMSPPGQTYTRGWYLNMEYMDDQYPGPAWWGARNVQGMDFHNPPPTWNSEKWIRLACVEPIEASRIAVNPREVKWPEWVKAGTTEPQEIIVINEGNVLLNVYQIGAVATPASSWLTVSESPTEEVPFEVPAGVTNTNTFSINIDAAGITEPTWLEGYVWLKSNAANADSLAIPIRVLAADTVEPAIWDTVMSHANMFDPYADPSGECVALAVSNHGEIGGLGGTLGKVNWDPYALPDSAGRVNLDYKESGQECGTRVEDAIYLHSGSPFVIMADAWDGTGATLTCSYNDADQADVTGWDPTAARGSLRGGIASGGAYDSVYTGMFVNRDTTIAMERTFYAPRSTHPQDDTINFVICYTKVFSANGNGHNHVTIGNVIDWNVPSDVPGINTTSVMHGHAWGDELLVRVEGTDTGWSTSCQSNVYRSGAEAFLNGYTDAEYESNPCVISEYDFHGMNASSQNLLRDTAYHFYVPVDPPQPNPLEWWQLAATGGLHPDYGYQDQAVWLTYAHDYSLGATDTLNFWTALITTRYMYPSLSDVYYVAKYWFWDTLRPGCYARTCCSNRVGDVNLSRDYPDEVTLSDIMLLVDVKFISGDCSKLQCIAEADVNQDGGVDPTCEEHVRLGDIMILVDFLFITGPQTAVLNTCL